MFFDLLASMILTEIYLSLVDRTPGTVILRRHRTEWYQPSRAALPVGFHFRQNRYVNNSEVCFRLSCQLRLPVLLARRGAADQKASCQEIFLYEDLLFHIARGRRLKSSLSVGDVSLFRWQTHRQTIVGKRDPYKDPLVRFSEAHTALKHTAGAE